MTDKKPIKYSPCEAAPPERRAFQIMDGAWSVKLWPRLLITVCSEHLGERNVAKWRSNKW
jgi:hypothetical protein